MNTLDKVYDLTIDIKNIDVKYNSYAKFFDDDRETSVIRIKLLNDKTPMNLENCIVEAYFILANNTYHDETCKIINTSEGIVELQLCQECLVVGKNTVRLSILKENEIANTPVITYEVRKGLYSDNPNFNDDPLTPVLSQMLLDVKVTKANQIELQERYEQSFPRIELKIKEVDEKIKEVNLAIASGTQDLEVKEARANKKGIVYTKLGDRLDEVDSQLEHNMNKSVGVINAKFPPLNFNVEGLKGGGVEGDGERLVNLISYLSSNFSFSTLELPYDIYSIECEIVIPNNVKVYGINRPILDFKIDEGVAIYLYNNNHNIFKCVELKGKSLCSNVVALRVEGSSNTIDDIIIYKFKQGIDFARPNTYNNTFNNIFIKETQLCLYGDFVGANTVNNAGERITFKNSTFCNSNELLFFNSGILDLYFDNCSLDYCKKFINANNGRAYFNNCHIETKRDEDNCDWATTNDYLIQTNNDPHLFFTNCEFHLYNIHRIVDPTSTLGEIRYNNCQCWFTNNEGTSQYCYSEHNFFWNIHEGMIQSEYNAFVSKVTRPGCLMCCDYNNNQTPSIPKMSINVEECKLTFEFTEEQKPKENTYIKILFS